MTGLERFLVGGRQLEAGRQLADDQPPGWMRRAEIPVDVSACYLGEVGPPLIRDKQARLADGAQQPAGQRAAAGPGLQHPGAGEHVG